MDIYESRLSKRGKRDGFEATFQRLSESDSSLDANIGRMMLELIEHLRSDVIGPRLLAKMPRIRGEQLWLSWGDGHSHRLTIRVGVDFYDRSPLVDRPPKLHYRLRVDTSRNGTFSSGVSTIPSAELRTCDVREVGSFILETIRACKDET